MATLGGPLAEILELERQVQRDDGDDCWQQLISHNSILAEIAGRGRLEECLVDVYCRLAAARSLRAGRAAVEPDPDAIRELHQSLHGVPGLPPEPLPAAVLGLDDEITHLDTVLHRLND
jgi:hypothetical protein